METAEEFIFDEDLFNSFYNFTLPDDENYHLASPCSVNVPGFNSLGLMISLIIVSLFGMVGNGIVVCVVYPVRKKWATTDIYLMHLAMADLLFCLTLPFWAVETHAGWIFGNFLCKLLSAFQEASVYSSVFLLACISVDRYFSIVRATRTLPSHHVLVKVGCGAVWLVAGFLSLPVAIQKESMAAEDLGQTICYENLTGQSSDQWRVALHVLRHTLGFFMPLVVMAVCYACTAATLVNARNQKKRKAIRVILAVVSAFVLCWLPYNVTVLMDTLRRGGSLEVETCGSRYRLQVMLNVTQVLAFTHCAVNPVLYAFIGERFRKQLLSTVRSRGLLLQKTGSAKSEGSSRSKNSSFTM